MPEQQGEREAGGQPVSEEEAAEAAAGEVEEAAEEGAGEEGPVEETAGEETAGGDETPESAEAVVGEIRERGEVEAAMEEPGGGQEEAAPMELAELGEEEDGSPAGSIELLMDVDLEVKIELGRAQLAIEDILKLRKGSVVELDKLAGDPVDILVNDRPVAKGEILVVNDNFCVRLTEILDPEARLKAGGEEDE